MVLKAQSLVASFYLVDFLYSQLRARHCNNLSLHSNSSTPLVVIPLLAIKNCVTMIFLLMGVEL